METVGAVTGGHSVTTVRLPFVAALAVWLIANTGCETSDVGAPCNHGPAEPQETLTVTFPALSCTDLVCVYSDRQEPPEEPCQDHADCNADGSSDEAFRCEDGRCTVAAQHVLEHSMCSQFCSADADCDNGDADTNCRTGFACIPPQDLGPYCCQKMCVCRDDLDLATALDRAEQCEAGTHPGCCLGPDRPDTCGPA